jgi:NADH dehydrogenase/NADH:ubiquinone oxidoreductase subunit G
MEELLTLKNKELENSFGKKISNINSSLIRNINTLQAGLIANDKSSLEKLNTITETLEKLANSKNSSDILESLSTIKSELLLPNFMKITDTIENVQTSITQSSKEMMKNLFGITNTLNNSSAKTVSKVIESITNSTNKITQMLDFENQNQLFSNHVSNILKSIKLSHDHITSLSSKTDVS